MLVVRLLDQNLVTRILFDFMYTVGMVVPQNLHLTYIHLLMYALIQGMLEKSPLFIKFFFVVQLQ